MLLCDVFIKIRRVQSVLYDTRFLKRYTQSEPFFLGFAYRL